jgi:5,6,7,8-tetrahydromethanopterin hydro-lyase
MADRIVLRVGESLVAGGPPGTAAEPEVAIGEMDGPFGTAFANLLGDQVKGHSRVLALLNTDVMVRPPTLCVSKVTVKDTRYTNILMGTVQYATAMGVLDSVRAGDIPKDKVDELGVIVSVWLNPGIVDVKDLDHQVLFDIHQGDGAGDPQGNDVPALDRLAAREPGQGRAQIFRKGPEGRGLAPGGLVLASERGPAEASRYGRTAGRGRLRGRGQAVEFLQDPAI